MTDLIKCSRCQTKKLPEFYSANPNTNIRYKTCDICRQTCNSCHLCDKKFGQKSNLTTHINNVHNKEKLHQCELCDMKFGLKSSLTTHIRVVHNKETPYHCTTCDSKFGTNGSLTTHIKTVHLNEKPYECELCDYKCGEKSNLKKHIKICTGKDNCSSGEYKIKQILNKMNIPYNYNSTNGLRSIKGWLRWDFIILTNDEPIFIEFDGAQHFRPVKFGGMSAEKAQENFEKGQAHDKIKNDYCKSEGYLLLRINYKDYDTIDENIIEFITDNTDYSLSESSQSMIS